MGRPPIFRKALTPAQHQKRYRQRLKLKAKDALKSAAQERRRLSREARPIPDGMDYRIGDAREVLADIDAKSTAAIITDPPYDRDKAEALYRWLADFSAHALIDGGSVILFTGHLNIARDVQLFQAAGLRYWWTLALLHTSPFRRVPGTFSIAEHKPVLHFVRGARRRDQSFIPDVLRPKHPAREKDLHPWALGEAGVGFLIEHLTRPGELIVDPFAAAGLWGEIAVEKGRYAICCDIEQGGSDRIVAD